MATQIKITQLADIGSANIAVTTLLPVVNMAGVSTTQKTTLGNLANVVLSQTGGNYVPAALASIAYSVANAAQPNITSVGTLTNLDVANSIIANGTAYLGNISTTGAASITTLIVGTTADLGSVNNVIIEGGTDGQVLTTDGDGNLSWTTVSSGNSSYGDSNVVTLLNAFGSNTITTTGNISGGNVLTSAQVIANGIVESGTGFSTGGYLSVDGNTDLHNTIVTGNLSATGNITANNIGNIATINLTGSNSNVLYGNGVFAPASGGNANTGNISFNDTAISTPLPNANIYINGNGPNGHVEITANSFNWTFDPDGNMTLSDGTKLGAFNSNSIGFDVSSNNQFEIQTDNGSNTYSWVFNKNGSMIFPATVNNEATIQSYGNTSNTGSFVKLVTGASANLIIGTSGNNHIVINADRGGSNVRWNFDDTGNLTLPGNTFAVNYANGTQVSIGGGGANTGNVTFDDVTVQGVNQLNLSWDPLATANLAYLQVRGGDVASHIHLDTGNNEAYDLIVGDDAKFVQVSSTGDIIMSSYDGNTSYIWTFDQEGNLILAGGESAIQSVANSSLDPLNPNVSTMILTPSRGYSSQSLVLDPTAPGHIHLRAPSANIDEPLANIFLGGEESSFEVGYYNGSAPNLYIHSGNNTWTFDNVGNLTLPGNTFAVNYANGTQVSIGGGGNTSQISNGNSNVSIPTSNDNVYITTNNGSSKQWIFDTAGNLRTPGNIDIYGAINFPQQVSSINWSTYNIELSQYGRINTNVDFFANANVIGAQYLKGDGSNITNISIPKIANGTSNVNIPTSNGNIVISANGTANWTLDTNGNLTIPGGGAVWNTGANTVGLTANFTDPYKVNLGLDYGSNIATLAGANAVAITANTGINTKQWTFDTNGNLTLPGNLVIAGNTSVFGTDSALIQPSNNLPLIAISSGANGAVSSVWVEDIGNVGTSNIAAVYANPTIGSGIVRIAVGQNGGNAGPNLWDFGTDGNLTIPGTSGGFIKTVSNASIGVAAVDNGTNNPAQLLSINAGSGAATSIVSAYATNATIQTNASGNINTWSFNNAGNLTLPTGGQIIVSGGLVSSGASPAPTINGFSITNSVGISGTGNIAGNNISATGTLTATGKIGYASGSTVTQTSNRGNGVNINALAGTIVTVSASMTAGEIGAFSVTNNQVDTNNDIVLVQVVSPNLGNYNVIANPNSGIGGFYLTLQNISGFPISAEAVTIRFMVIKAPNA